MPNTERPRARPKLRNRSRLRDRSSTPDEALENHLQKLFEEQEILHNLLVSHRPVVKSQLEDLGGESNYEFDTPDEEPEEEKVPNLKEPIEEEPDLNNEPEHVILAEDVDDSSPPKFEDIPLLPPRMYPYRKKHISSVIPIPKSVGKCTPPKLSGQGFDPPFLYPEFVAKNEGSRVKYIFTLVDGLVMQMERFLKLSERSVGEGALKKPSTGTVPKCKSQNQLNMDRVGQAKYTITVNPRSREPKPHSQSKDHRSTKKREQSHSQMSRISSEPDFDLDCEFGMEHIEKFRANRVRHEFPKGRGSEYGPEKPTDTTDAAREVCADAGASITLPTMENEFSLLAIYQAANAKALKKQRKRQRRDDNVTPRPGTPMTRPCSPIEEGSPRSAGQGTFYEIFAGHRDPDQPESSILAPWRLLKAKGPPPLEDWQVEIVRFMRKYNREKKRRQRLAENNEEVEVTPRKSKSLTKLLKKLEKSRKDFEQKYSDPPNDGRKLRKLRKQTKFYKAHKRQREWLKLSRQYKRLQYLYLFKKEDLFKPDGRVVKEQASRLSIWPQKPITPRPMPRVETPKLPTNVWPADMEPDANAEVPEQVDRGQRLKNLLMDGVRLKRQEKLRHLVAPVDPLKAVYVPLLRRRTKLLYLNHSEGKMEGELQIDPDSPRSFYSTSTGLSARKGCSTRRSSFSTLSSFSCSKSMASVSTLFYDAKLPPQDVQTVDGALQKGNITCDVKTATGLPLSEAGNVPEIEEKKRAATGGYREAKKESPGYTEVPLERYSDFRRYYDIDAVSLQILHWMSRMKPKRSKPPIEGLARIAKYMDHFYWNRLLRDELFFHWFVNEGFFAAHYLTALKEAQELELLANDQLDEQIFEYMEQVNKPDGRPLPLTWQMGYVMVTSYFRVLHCRASSKKRQVEDRFLLRCRMAIVVVEHFQEEQGRRVMKDAVNCRRLLEWAFRHEGRLVRVCDEPLAYAEERAGIDTCLVMRTPNLESFNEFYYRRVMPRPDALAINPLLNKIRRYPNRGRLQLHEFDCPVQGCGTGLNSRVLMSHFLTDHCRRLEELWLSDRMVLMFYPSSYPPTTIYCICVIALLMKMPSKATPVPRIILNEELPSKYLYFAEHAPCLLMYAQVQRSTVEATAVQKLPPAAGPWEVGEGQKNTIYIFWLAIPDCNLKNVCCRVYIYCQDRSLRGRSLLDFTNMSKFKGVADLFINHPKNYLAIDYPTMASLTKDFTEMLFIEVRYVNKLVDDPEDSGDETFDV
ncbi:uncharacterized protein LOC108021986 isoform X2 [Drosophila biarmipes]|uniref:uncharacterized protein LOC108021986 isoform X2 n=1 Tax=Drosophila biarmipes TaxID=125945 RepID=UPI0021CCFBF9|nr:uncharacterized protein LOC108021986 isoform X2 [Drosophila biarmipes]